MFCFRMSLQHILFISLLLLASSSIDGRVSNKSRRPVKNLSRLSFLKVRICTTERLISYLKRLCPIPKKRKMNDATDGVNKPVFDVERPLYARRRRNLYSGTIFINKYVYVLLMIHYQKRVLFNYKRCNSFPR